MHNAHRLVRSEAAATGLRWLRQANNPMRRIGRRVLPPKLFDRIGQGLVEANHGLYSDDTVAPDVREALGRYYRPRNQRLEEILGRDLSHWTGMSA